MRVRCSSLSRKAIHLAVSVVQLKVTSEAWMDGRQRQATHSLDYIRSTERMRNKPNGIANNPTHLPPYRLCQAPESRCDDQHVRSVD